MCTGRYKGPVIGTSNYAAVKELERYISTDTAFRNALAKVEDFCVCGGQPNRDIHKLLLAFGQPFDKDYREVRGRCPRIRSSTAFASVQSPDDLLGELYRRQLVAAEDGCMGAWGHAFIKLNF